MVHIFLNLKTFPLSLMSVLFDYYYLIYWQSYHKHFFPHGPDRLTVFNLRRVDKDKTPQNTLLAGVRKVGQFSTCHS